MDSGLSPRTERIAGEVDPTPLTLAPPLTQHPSTIDLSTAQNEIIRPGILDVFKSIVQNGINIDVSAHSGENTLQGF